MLVADHRGVIRCRRTEGRQTHHKVDVMSQLFLAHDNAAGLSFWAKS